MLGFGDTSLSPSIGNTLSGTAAIFALWGYKSLLWRSRHRSRLATKSILWGRGEVTSWRQTPTSTERNLSTYEICRRVWSLAHSATLFSFCTHFKESLALSCCLHIEKLLFYSTLITGLLSLVFLLKKTPPSFRKSTLWDQRKRDRQRAAVAIYWKQELSPDLLFFKGLQTVKPEVW